MPMTFHFTIYSFKKEGSESPQMDKITSLYFYSSGALTLLPHPKHLRPQGMVLRCFQAQNIGIYAQNEGPGSPKLNILPYYILIGITLNHINLTLKLSNPYSYVTSGKNLISRFNKLI